MNTTKVKLKIENISKQYEDNTIVINNVSVNVKDKEIVAIVGPSGCGKSTLLKIVAGLLDPSSGKVLINNKNISGPSKERGMVFQQPTPFPWLTVLKNVEFGLMLQKITLEKRTIIAKHYLGLVGLSNFENYYIKNLSGGMKQRVAIATVLANDPEILLMDEPFSALDLQTKGLMQELILAIWEETKKTILFATHDIEEAIFLADRVYVMSTRPGIIKEVINIDLPKPRTADIKMSEQFINIKKHISYLIRGEAIKAAQIKLENIRPNALKIGTIVWPGYAPLYLAEELGLFKKYGLEVELVSLEKDEDRISALYSGAVDLLTQTSDSIPRGEQKDLSLFLCLDRSIGGDALLAREGITNIQELIGKTVAIEEDWVSQFFWLYLLDKYNISKEEVKTINLKGSDIGAALVSGKIVAAVLWEPWLTQAKRLCKGKILSSTKEEPVVLDVLITTRKIASQKEEQLKKLVAIWFESLEYIKKKPDHAFKLMAIPYGISTTELKEEMKGLELADIKINKFYFGTEHHNGEIHQLLEKTAEILFKNGIIQKQTGLSKVINPKFIRKSL